MATWKNISLTNPVTGELDVMGAEIELNRRLRQAFANIDISQILFNLNDIGGTLNLSKGGTGQALSAPAADRLFFYDKSGNKTDWLELGTGLSISGTTLSAVLSSVLLGTTNQITVTDNGNGTYTLSTPQSLDTSADVEFDSVKLDDLTASRMVSADANKKIVSISDLTAWIAGTANQITVTSDGDGTLTLSFPTNMKFGNVAGGNYTEVESDGTLKFAGSATVWKDIDFPIIIRTTGTNVPSLTTLQGNITAPQWQINDFNVCEGQEFVHEWKEGSVVRWHLHMITNGLEAVDKYVKWEVEWFWVDVDGQLSATDTQSYEYTIPANTPDKTMVLVPIYQWTPTNGNIGAQCYARLKRMASTGTAPVGDPWCTMLQLHIECDTFGSRDYQTK